MQANHAIINSVKETWAAVFYRINNGENSACFKKKNSISTQVLKHFPDVFGKATKIKMG